MTAGSRERKVTRMRTTAMAAGDTIVIASPGHSASSPDRRGEILAVAGEAGCACYLVRWPDGSTTVVSTAAGAVVHAQPRADGDPSRRRAPD